MNRFARSAALAFLLAGGSMSILAATTSLAYAQPEGTDTEIGREVGELYNDAAIAFRDDMDFPAAHAFLAEARAVEDKTPWETYSIEKLDMQLYLNQQELDLVVGPLTAMLDSSVAPQEDREAFTRIAMLLANNTQDYPRVIAYGTEALNYPGWDDQADDVLGTAYYFNNDFVGAEQFALGAIARKEVAGESPTLQTLNVLLNAQQEQGKEAEAMQTAGRIAAVDPTPANWVKVIDYITAPNLEDQHFFNLYRLRRETGSLAPQDYVGMVNMAQQMGLPVELQSVLDEAIAAGYLQASDVADAAATARELTAQMETQLGDLASEAAADASGMTEVIYGELLLSNGSAAEAEAALRRGIEKGGLARAADAQILLGIAQLEQGKAAEAQMTFQQAEQDPIVQAVAWAWGLFASI